MKTIIGILAAAMVGLGSVAAAAEDMQKQYTDEELIEILKDAGYRAVEKLEDRVIAIEVGGLTYTMYVYDDDDLQLYFGLTGYVISKDTINEWNKNKRLSRAYIDDENDPVVESDLLANAGYSPEQLVEFVNVFDIVARDFRQFVTDYDEGEMDGETSDTGYVAGVDDNAWTRTASGQ